MSEPRHVDEAVQFRCGEAEAIGVLSRPARDVRALGTSVLIVVGGPQYRVGSHRQFVLLARRLASAGYATLRFDYRGMGDSHGDMRDFQAVGHDLRAAVDTLVERCPDARRVVIWGLCDAASAAFMYAKSDPRVIGIVGANPWVRSDASLAAATIKHYYGGRLLQREFWAKVLSGRYDIFGSVKSLIENVRSARAGGGVAAKASFQERMANGLAGFRGRVLLLLSGNDITAKEFVQYTAATPSWKGVLGRVDVSRVEIPEADHTFSSRAWRHKVEKATLEWLAAQERTAGYKAR